MRPPHPVEPSYLDLKAASIYTSLSVRTLRKVLAEPDGLPFYRVRGKILILKDDIDRWLLGFRREPVSLEILVEEVLAEFKEDDRKETKGKQK